MDMYLTLIGPITDLLVWGIFSEIFISLKTIGYYLYYGFL